MIHVKFFASLREQLGLSSLNVDYSGQQKVSDLIANLYMQNKQCEKLKEQHILVAVNHTLCDKEAAINDGDEVAFFPPVTGG